MIRFCISLFWGLHVWLSLFRRKPQFGFQMSCEYIVADPYLDSPLFTNASALDMIHFLKNFVLFFFFFRSFLFQDFSSWHLFSSQDNTHHTVTWFRTTSSLFWFFFFFKIALGPQVRTLKSWPEYSVKISIISFCFLLLKQIKQQDINSQEIRISNENNEI